MQLYYFLAVILSLSLGSLPDSNQSFGHALAFTALVILAWWCLSYLAVRLVSGLIDDGEVTVDVGYRCFDRQTECLRWLSLALILLCLGAFGLGRNLDQLPVIKHSLAAQSMILLTPALAMMIGLWTGEYLFAVRMGFARSGLWRTVASVFDSLRCSVGWLLVPILGIMLIVDLVSLTSIGSIVPQWMGWGALATAMVVGIPVLVRRIFPTMAWDQPTRCWIESIVESAGIRHCRIVMWDTGGRTHNALIAGLLGRFRVLLLSDRLVKDLSRAELSMVILHEVAHAKRYHVPLRIAALLPAWILGAVLESVIRTEWAGAEWAGAEWAGTLGSLLSIIATVLILRLVSYRSEYDADAIACRLAPDVAKHCTDVPASQADASRHLASALLKVTAECEAARKPTWLHPGISNRIDAFSPSNATILA